MNRDVHDQGFGMMPGINDAAGVNASFREGNTRPKRGLWKPLLLSVLVLCGVVVYFFVVN